MDSKFNMTRDTEYDAGFVVGALLRVCRLIRSQLTAAYDEVGLNESRFLVLRTIRQLESDGCTQTRLAQVLDQSESNICTLVERMRSDGLLYRQKPKLDRRKKFLLLTDLGRTKLEQSEATYDNCCRLIMQRLDTHQQRQLAELLQRFMDCWQTDETGEAVVEQISATPIPSPHMLVNGRNTSGTKDRVHSNLKTMREPSSE